MDEESNKIHISEALNLLEEWFLKRICQLFLIIDNGKVCPEGSGILIEIFSLRILVTAGHVIMDGRHNHLCFPNLNSEGMTHLDGVWYPSDNKTNIGKDFDDFAYLVMNDSTYKSLVKNGYKFIQIDNIDFEHIASPKKNILQQGLGGKKLKK